MLRLPEPCPRSYILTTSPPMAYWLLRVLPSLGPLWTCSSAVARTWCCGYMRSAKVEGGRADADVSRYPGREDVGRSVKLRDWRGNGLGHSGHLRPFDFRDVDVTLLPSRRRLEDRSARPGTGRQTRSPLSLPVHHPHVRNQPHTHTHTPRQSIRAQASTHALLSAAELTPPHESGTLTIPNRGQGHQSPRPPRPHHDHCRRRGSPHTLDADARQEKGR